MVKRNFAEYGHGGSTRKKYKENRGKTTTTGAIGSGRSINKNAQFKESTQKHFDPRISQHSNSQKLVNSLFSNESRGSNKKNMRSYSTNQRLIGSKNGRLLMSEKFPSEKTQRTQKNTHIRGHGGTKPEMEYSSGIGQSLVQSNVHPPKYKHVAPLIGSRSKSLNSNNHIQSKFRAQKAANYPKKNAKLIDANRQNTHTITFDQRHVPINLNSSGSIAEKFSKNSTGSQPFSMGRFRMSGFLSPKNANSTQTERGLKNDNFSLGSKDNVKLNYSKKKAQQNSHFLDTQKSASGPASVQMKFVNVPGLENGQEKITQDSVLINKFKVQGEVFFVFAVFDGHGRHGHFISQYAKKNCIPAIKYFLKKQFASKKVRIPEVLRNACQYLNMKINKISEKYTKKQGKKKKMVIIDSGISQEPSINHFDASLSGTTCSLVLLYKSKLYSLSLGDSKGILGVLHPGESSFRLMPYMISTEHKASSKSEQTRIHSQGGFVHPIRNHEGVEVGPLRIWDSSHKYPGLMVSRSFGDLIGKTCGVSGEPDILEINLRPCHRCLILASDGFWDMHSNLDALNGFYSKGTKGLVDIEKMLVTITRQTLDKWQKNFGKVHRDDISIILVYFDFL